MGKDARKSLVRLPKNQRELLVRKISQLASDPYAPNNNATKLKDRPGYRLRVGDWRIVYELRDSQLLILVVKIGSRGSIYP